MRTLYQSLALYFQCARRILPWFIGLIRASLILLHPGISMIFPEDFVWGAAVSNFEWAEGYAKHLG